MSALEQPAYKPHRPPLDNLEPLTPEQRQRFLDAVKANPKAGNIATLRTLELVNPNGYTPTRGQLRRLLEADEDLEAEAREVRGHVWQKVEAVVWEVALDKDHPKWDKAMTLIGAADGGRRFVPRGRMDVAVEHGGSVDVNNPDVAQAIERFTAGVVQLAERRRAELASGDAE